MFLLIKPDGDLSGSDTLQVGFTLINVIKEKRSRTEQLVMSYFCFILATQLIKPNLNI